MTTIILGFILAAGCLLVVIATDIQAGYREVSWMSQFKRDWKRYVVCALLWVILIGWMFYGGE